MTRYLFLFLAFLALAGCVSAPQQRPQALVQGERMLELGVQAFRGDDYASAASYFTQALRHYQGLDDRRGMLNSRINLAETALAVGNVESCERHLHEAALIAKGAKVLRLQLLTSSAALHKRNYDESLTALTPLLMTPPEDVKLYLSALANRVEIALGRTDADAPVWVDRYMTALKGAEAGPFAARLHRYRAILANQGGDTALADAQMQQALDLYKALPARPGIAATLEEWGRILVGQQRWAEAEDRLQRALHIRLWLLARLDTAANLRQLAVVSEASGQPERAKAQLRWADIAAGDGPVNWTALKHEVLP